MKRLISALSIVAGMFAAPAFAQQSVPKPQTLFTNVNVFDGTNEKLLNNANVLVEGNLIKQVSTTAISAQGATVVDGKGRTLMPGLSDAHWHLLQSNIVNIDMLTKDPQYITIAMALGAERVLMNGVTTVRDMGGDVFGVKQMIDEGRIPGPRILPSGAFLTQTSGHADFRFPNAVRRAQGRELIDPEIVGYTIVADGVAAVRQRSRENLMKGASQLKVMAGGGVSSFSDPLDVAQYSQEELRAIVEEADNWNTYVTVHAYTAKAIQHAIKAGVKSVEHGQLMDEETAKMIADKGVWVSMQPFLDDEDALKFEPGSFNEQKYKRLLAGVDTAYNLAKKYNIKVGFGTDFQNDPKLIDRQTAQIPKLARWFKPIEVLRMVTSGNQEMFRLSGPRHPYQAGPLGVIKEGAYADLLLVDGNPLTNIGLLNDPAKNFVVIMKDGKVYKNTVG